MDIKKCIACGSGTKFLGSNKNLRILKCTKCGLGVTQDSAQEKYSAYHRDPSYIKEQKLFSNIFKKRVKIISQFKTSGKALEVGCSTGTLLSLLAHKGWEVQGIEPSVPAATTAEERGIPTLITTFEKAEFPAGSFDILIFNHVLEHLKSPRDILEKAHKILKEDGIIFIDVPNFGSISARIRGANWGYAAPDEHLWHFTKESLFILLKKSGFSPIYWEARSGVWDYGSPIKEIWQSLVGRKKRFLKNVLTILPTLIITKLKKGTSLTVVAKKYTSL